MTGDTDTLLNVAWILAKEHRTPAFLLWTAQDWNQTCGVELRLLPDDKVEVGVRDLGPGWLVTSSERN